MNDPSTRPDNETPRPSPDRLAWLDLEMTGLDPACDVILQAALIITNDQLEVLEEASFDIWQPEAALQVMTPFVRDMHDKNGLLSRVRASRIDTLAAQRELLGIVARWCSYPATLCGNSIWSDRKFIDRYMPAFSGYLHYRMVDVSSLKVLAARWFGSEAQFVKPAQGEHDALVDI